MVDDDDDAVVAVISVVVDSTATAGDDSGTGSIVSVVELVVLMGGVAVLGILKHFS